MTIHELRETLGKLYALLQAADAKAATLKGLAEFIELTQEFGDLNLKAFVKLADTGRNPPAPPTGGRGGSSRGVTADPAAVSAELADLYARAADPAVTEEQVRAACAKLGGLKKDGLLSVAAGVGIEGMKSKKVGEIADAITSRLVERKGAAIRGQLIHRPTAPAGGSGTGGLTSGGVAAPPP